MVDTQKPVVAAMVCAEWPALAKKKNNVFMMSKNIFYNSYNGNKEVCDLFQTQK